MSGFKGTPGPWEVVKGDASFAIRASDTNVVWGGCGCCNGPNDSIDSEADARLIAAAPDLLEALELVLGNCLDSEGLVAAHAKARAAIAKATGGDE